MFGDGNISISTLLFPRRLQLSCTRKILETFTCFVVYFTAAFRVCEVILQLSHTCLKAFSRVGKHRAGNFHRWNGARMRRTNVRFSANQRKPTPWETKWEPTSVSKMAALPNDWRVTMEINSPNWQEIRWIRGGVATGHRCYPTGNCYLYWSRGSMTSFDTVRVPVFHLLENRTENRFNIPVNHVPVHKTICYG